MPLDIHTLRDEPEKVKKSQRMRYKNEEIVDEILQHDQEWKRTAKELQSLTKEYKRIKKQIYQIEVRFHSKKLYIPIGILC